MPNIEGEAKRLPDKLVFGSAILYPRAAYAVYGVGDIRDFPLYLTHRDWIVTLGMHEAGKPLNYEDASGLLWKDKEAVAKNPKGSIMAYFSSLRSKLGGDSIVFDKGEGYRLNNCEAIYYPARENVSKSPSKIIRVGDAILDPASFKADWANENREGRPDFTLQEWKTLDLFASMDVVDHTTFRDRMGEYTLGVGSLTLKVIVNRLRTKLENPNVVETVYGTGGYKMLYEVVDKIDSMQGSGTEASQGLPVK